MWTQNTNEESPPVQQAFKERRGTVQQESIRQQARADLAAGVVHHVPLHLGLHKVPLPVRDVVGQVGTRPGNKEVDLHQAPSWTS